MTFTLPARRFGARVDARARHRRPGRSRPARQRWPSRGEVPVPARSMKLLRRVADGFRAPTGCSSRPSMDFAAVRELVPYLRDLGDLAPLPLAVAAGARRLDPRLRRRRPDPRLATRWAGRRACARWPARGPRHRARHRPNHMGVSDENRWWADERAARAVLRLDPATAGTGASSTSTTSPACASRTPRSSTRRTARSSSSCATGVLDGLRVDHPDGLADPARLPARACATRGAEHVWVEKILAPRRAAARLAGRGHGRLRVPQRRRGAVRRPGRRGGLTALYASSPASRGRSTRSPRRPARAGHDDVRAARSTACARCATSTAWPSAAGRAAGLPHLRRAVVRAGRGGRPRGDRAPPAARAARARAAPRASAATTSSSRASSRPRRRSRPRASRTPPSTATCGCSRSTRSAATRRASGSPSTPSTPPTRAAPSASRAGCSSPRRTTPSARATCARGSARSRAMADEWAEPCARWLG